MLLYCFLRFVSFGKGALQMPYIIIIITWCFKCIAPTFLDYEQKQISLGGNHPSTTYFHSLPYIPLPKGWVER